MTRKSKRIKPKRIKAKITRTVTEIAIVTLDQDGGVEEVLEVHEELGYDVIDIVSTLAVLDVY